VLGPAPVNNNINFNHHTCNMRKQSSALQMTLVAGRRAGVVQVSHRVLERPTHVVFCFWSLLLSSSAVEAQHCLRRRSPCVRRRQRDRGPSLLAPKKPRAAAGALAAIQQRCRVYRGPLLLAPKTPMRLLRRRRPCVHRRQCCQGHLLLAHFPSICSTRLAGSVIW